MTSFKNRALSCMETFFKGCIVILLISIFTSNVSGQTYSKDDTAKVNTMLKGANDSLHFNPVYSLKNAEEALKISRGLDNKTYIAKSLNFAGLANWRTGNTKKAIECFEESIKLCEENKLKLGEASALSNLSGIYGDLGNFGKSLEMDLKSLNIFEELKDSVRLLTCYSNIGNVLASMHYYTESNNCLYRSISIAKALNQMNKVAQAYSNLSGNFIEVKNYKEGFKYATQAIQIFDSLQDNSTIAQAYLNLGSCYYYTGNNDSAMYYFTKTLKITEQNRDLAVEVVTLNSIGEINLKKKNLQLAEDYFKRSLELATMISSMVDIQLANNNLADVYAEKGDYKNAYKYYVEAAKINDSLMNDENVKAIASLTSKFELKEKDEENKTLKTENDLQKLRLLHKDIYIYGTAGAALLILVIAFLLIRQTRIKMKHEIFELEQKQLRAQMNPHFIFNCLNSIQHFMVQNDVLNANKYLTDFASLMRKTLELSEGGTITLHKEIDYLDNYLLLEQLRFGNKFTYEIKCDDSIETNSVEIPPMVVQPFVENAIRHGLRYLDGNTGILKINFYRLDEIIICEVDDNGIGREKSQQLKSLSHIEYQSRGMELTQKRLELISKVTNSDFKILITDKKDNLDKPTGTKVTIKFPIQS